MNLDTQLTAPQERVYFLVTPLTLNYIDFASLNEDFSGVNL